MGKIIRIFTNDLQTVYKNIIAFIVVIGITILPALYSWFNIASNWDPYSATAGIPFAVCNLDEGYTVQGLTVDAGQQIIDQLKGNPKMGWDFVSEKEAVDGVTSGKYYAAVVIPAKFSENLCSLTTGEFVESELDYYVNEKKNAIAPKITNAGITTIEQEVKSAYVSTVTNVLATMLNLTAAEIGDQKDTAIDSLTESLTDVTNDIDSFNAGVGVFITSLKMLKNVLVSSEELLPEIGTTLSQSGQVAVDVQSAINTTRSASAKVTEALAHITDILAALHLNVNERLTVAFETLKTDSEAAARQITDLTSVTQKTILLTDYLRTTLKNIATTFQLDLSALTSLLDASIQRQQTLNDNLLAAASAIRSTGALPSAMMSTLQSAAAACAQDAEAIRSGFREAHSLIDTAVDKAYDMLVSATDILQTVGGNMPKVQETLDNTADSLDEMILTFQNVQTMMTQSKGKLTRLIERVDTLKGETALTELLMAVIHDPAALSQFFSQPVTTVTHSIHGVENYGSGMAPFYTSLGIWVGGIVLIAIVRVELTEKQYQKLKRPGKTQQYFGRYLIFFLLGQIQALIVSLGDIYFLGIQCNSPALFVLGCMISAFVYTLIIYSLTITFNVIGKALAVIILVLQVAGSGGTFPLEVLPQPFQSIAPFLPFRYGNDILREAVAGPDMANYWQNVLLLLVFVPFALVLGLVLRRPCVKLMHFLDKRIHQSELII